MDGHRLELKILGPFEAIQFGQQLALPRGKLRWILASLVLELGRAVPERRLVEQVWGPSGASSAALRSATSRLRSWLAEVGLGDDIRIEHTGTAYVMCARRTLLDAAKATALFHETGYGSRRLDRLIEAAELWREPVLADAPPGLRHHPVAAELDHMRSRCVGELGELAAQLGQSALVLGILRHAARDAPYDEPVQAAYITAAHECGLRTEAVRHYDTVCRYLASDLGVSPSPTLLAAARALRQGGIGMEPVAVLGATGPASVTVPSDILPPAPTKDFIGRAVELGFAQYVLTDTEGPSVMYVSGAPGVGKTELCLQAAAELRAGGFQRILYAAMRGSTPHPAAPHDVLARFVHAMDPAAAGSADPRVLAGRYQDLLARHSTLIVLDDVAGPAQMAPLVPEVPGCLVLANGRGRAPALHECTVLELCTLTMPAGISLLAGLIGDERIERSRDAFESIFTSVDGHPAALRIAGLRLAARPGWRPEDLADRLRDHSTLIEELSHDDLSLRDVFDGICGRLDAITRAHLHRICSTAPPDRVAAFTVPRAQLPMVPDHTLDRLQTARLIAMQREVSNGQHTLYVPNLVRAMNAVA